MSEPSEPSEPPARRLFVAVMLPNALCARLAVLVDLIEAQRALLRPARASGLHLTLRFLGDTTAADEQLVREACAEAVSGLAPFTLSLRGFGAFPNRERPRIFWLGVDMGTRELGLLHDRLEEGLRRRQVSGRDGPFSLHLTLARVRSDASPAALRALGLAIAGLPTAEQARCTVAEIALVHSELTPHGSRYTIVGVWPLARQISRS